MTITPVYAGRQVSSHQSNYMYGIEKRQVFEQVQNESVSSPVNTSRRQETIYQFRHIEGWAGDMPVTFTYLNAKRVYHITKELFAGTSWRTQPIPSSSWVA